MEDEFIYWPHPTPAGIKVEEISGMESKNGRTWREMALQIYCENGRDNYREIGHFPGGAPFIFGSTSRISITHTGHLLAVATLPKTPEADLSAFSPRAAMGIDAESIHRVQVLKVRSKFLSDSEMEMIAEDNVEANIVAWTAKEALYKAGMTEGLDFRKDISIISLPAIDRNINIPGNPPPVFGKATISLPDTDLGADSSERKNTVEMDLYSYLSDNYCITLAFSPKCAKFGRKNS